MKDQRYNLRMTQKEKEQIRKKADAVNRPMSEYIIDTALNHKIVVINDLGELITELKALGRNFNQLTTLANMGRIQVVKLDEFEETLSEIHSRLREITEVI